MPEYLPEAYTAFRVRYPQVTEALDVLGSASDGAGPLECNQVAPVEERIAVLRQPLPARTRHVHERGHGAYGHRGAPQTALATSASTPSPAVSSQRSASRAAMQPEPAEVTAWR